MATVESHYIDARGCPRFARAILPDTRWVEVNLSPDDVDANRVSVRFDGGAGRVAHTVLAGAEPGPNDDYGTVPQGAWAAIDFDPHQAARLFVAGPAGTAVELHYTRRQTCECAR